MHRYANGGQLAGYFAVLPGKRWRWVGVGARSAVGAEENAVVLGEPRRIYDAIVGCSRFDGPIPLAKFINVSMSLGKEHVRRLIDIYLRAWTSQDPDLIVTIFTPSATYHERILREPIRGHAGCASANPLVTSSQAHRTPPFTGRGACRAGYRTDAMRRAVSRRRH